MRSWPSQNFQGSGSFHLFRNHLLWEDNFLAMKLSENLRSSPLREELQVPTGPEACSRAPTGEMILTEVFKELPNVFCCALFLSQDYIIW